VSKLIQDHANFVPGNKEPLMKGSPRYMSKMKLSITAVIERGAQQE
jgi:hypothetical protein